MNFIYQNLAIVMILQFLRNNFRSPQMSTPPRLILDFKMKYKTIISICGISYIMLGIGIPFGAKLITDKKDNRLHFEAINNLQDFFAKQDKFVSIAYSDKEVSFERVSIPKFSDTYIWYEDSDKQQYEWKQDYGDIYKMYKLKPKYESDDEWTGFRFDVIEPLSGWGVSFYHVYPYMVGYRKQSQSYIYSYMPSVQTAVDEAFDFWNTDDKSSYIKYIDNNISMYNVERYIENEYYMLFSYDECRRWFGKEYADSLVRAKGISYSPVGYETPCGYMYNGYYKVYNVKKPISNYLLIYNVFWDPKREDKKNIMIWGYSILSILLLSIVIPIYVKEKREEKLNAEGLKDRLLRCSNPQNFIKPYDEQKINAANDIYARLLNIAPNDETSLKELRKEISDKLDVNFVNSDLLNEMQRKCNPKNFMNPYNEEKIRIANLLYGKLVNGNLTIDELEDIQKEYEVKLKP